MSRAVRSSTAGHDRERVAHRVSTATSANEALSNYVYVSVLRVGFGTWLVRRLSKIGEARIALPRSWRESEPRGVLFNCGTDEGKSRQFVIIHVHVQGYFFPHFCVEEITADLSDQRALALAAESVEMRSDESGERAV